MALEKPVSEAPPAPPDHVVRVNVTVGTSSASVVGPMPGEGLLRLQLIGAGAAVSVTLGEGGISGTLNQGVVLTSGALYEFEFAVDRGEAWFIAAGPTLVRAFWRPR